MGSSHPLANMTFSASRLQTGLNCERKFGWQYIVGLEDPGTKATDFGTEVHAELETCKREPGYLPTTLTEVGAVATEALPYVEDFRLEDGATCEGNFVFNGPKHRWQGFIDLRKPGFINDYKTTSDFKWAKTEAELRHDPQAILYAAYEFTRWAGATVKLQWLYLRKRRPYAARPVIVEVTRPHVERCFKAMETVADHLQGLADAAPAAPELRSRYVLDVLQPNTDHCDAYGGCPYKSRCNLPFFAEPKKGMKPVGLLENLLKDEPSAANTQAPAPDASAASPTFEPTIEIPTDAAGPNTEPSLPVAAVAEPAEGINPPKRGRGRPKGSKNKAETPAQQIAAAATAIQPPETHTPPTEQPELSPTTAATPAHAAAHRITTLYVGCMPRGSDEAALVDFDLLISRAKIGIGPQDWRLFEYGKGNGLLLQMFEAIVQNDKPEHVVVVSPSSPEATLCLSYLRGASDTVVEAVAR